MALHRPSQPSSVPVPNDLASQLLQAAQAFLRSRESGVARSNHEKQAFDPFYDQYNSLLKQFLAACSLTSADADDCEQEAWLRILNGLPEFVADANTHQKLCSWIHTIVCTRAVDRERYRTRHPAQP